MRMGMGSRALSDVDGSLEKNCMVLVASVFGGIFEYLLGIPTSPAGKSDGMDESLSLSGRY